MGEEQLNNGENGLENTNPTPPENPIENPIEINFTERLDAFKEKFKEKKFVTSAAAKTYFTKNTEDKAELAFLYKHFFNKDFSNCTDCLLEAFIQLLKYNVSQEKEECKFLLFAGALLEDNVTFDANLAMSNFNITDEKCLFHLSQNPQLISHFQKKPDNWEELVEAYKAKK